MCWLAAIGLVVYGIGNQLDDSRKNCLTTGNLDGQKPSSTPAAKARPLSQEPSAVSHRKRRASMTGEALDAFRAASAERQRNRRARLRAGAQPTRQALQTCVAPESRSRIYSI
jgi:hypothetical protein